MIKFFSKHLLTTETVLNLPFINPVFCNWHQPISYQIVSRLVIFYHELHVLLLRLRFKRALYRLFYSEL